MPFFPGSNTNHSVPIYSTYIFKINYAHLLLHSISSNFIQKTDLHQSGKFFYFSYSTTTKRSVVQHTRKWSHDYANLGDREKLRYILYTEVLIFKEWRQHSISSTFHLFIPFSFKRRQVSFLYISLEELYTTGMEKNNGENRCMNTCFSTKHKVAS